jgi:hypothetical protein
LKKNILALKKGIILKDFEPFKKDQIIQIVQETDNTFFVKSYNCHTCKSFEVHKNFILIKD